MSVPNELNLEALWAMHGESLEVAADELEKNAALVPLATEPSKVMALAKHVFIEHMFDIKRFDSWIHSSFSGCSDLDLATRKAICEVSSAVRKAGFGDVFLSHEISLNLTDDELASVETSVTVEFDALLLVVGKKPAGEICQSISSLVDSLLIKGDKVNLLNLAKRTNNIAGNLLEAKDQTAVTETAKLTVGFAVASRECWRVAGNWKNLERAEWLCSRAYLNAGNATEALNSAEVGISIVESHGNDPVERVFLLAARSLCHSKSGNEALAIADRESVLKIIADNPAEDWIAGAVSNFLDLGLKNSG